MTFTVDLSPATVERLQAEAAANGKDVDTFVRETLEAKLAISGRSFRDIMAPVHADFRKSGMTDEELDSLVDQEVAATRAGRKVDGRRTSAFALPRDPDDVIYVNLAVTVKATHLVSRDKDLLSLMDDNAFREQFPSLSIVDPKTFLDHVRRDTGNTPGSGP